MPKSPQTHEGLFQEAKQFHAKYKGGRKRHIEAYKMLARMRFIPALDILVEVEELEVPLEQNYIPAILIDIEQARQKEYLAERKILQDRIEKIEEEIKDLKESIYKKIIRDHSTLLQAELKLNFNYESLQDLDIPEAPEVYNIRKYQEYFGSFLDDAYKLNQIPDIELGLEILPKSQEESQELSTKEVGFAAQISQEELERKKQIARAAAKKEEELEMQHQKTIFTQSFLKEIQALKQTLNADISTLNQLCHGLKSSELKDLVKHIIHAIENDGLALCKEIESGLLKESKMSKESLQIYKIFFRSFLESDDNYVISVRNHFNPQTVILNTISRFDFRYVLYLRTFEELKTVIRKIADIILSGHVACEKQDTASCIYTGISHLLVTSHDRFSDFGGNSLSINDSLRVLISLNFLLIAFSQNAVEYSCGSDESILWYNSKERAGLYRLWFLDTSSSLYRNLDFYAVLIFFKFAAKKARVLSKLTRSQISNKLANKLYFHESTSSQDIWTHASKRYYIRVKKNKNEFIVAFLKEHPYDENGSLKKCPTDYKSQFKYLLYEKRNEEFKYGNLIPQDKWNEKFFTAFNAITPGTKYDDGSLESNKRWYNFNPEIQSLFHFSYKE